MSRKIAYILPGYYDSSDVSAYKIIASWFKKKNIIPIIINFSWKRNTIKDWIKEFSENYNKNHQAGDVEYVLGFSMGAMIAFVSSPKINPKTQILCSLSPYFKEDIPRVKNWWKKMLGKKRIKVLSEISFDQIAKKNNSKVILLAGNREGKEIDMRFNEAKEKLKNCEAIIIENAKHNIGQKEYLNVLKKIINEFEK